IFATRAGWPDVAARCRQLIVSRNPKHLMVRFESFASALRDNDFAPFARRVKRFCPPERAEHLLSQMSVETRDPNGERTAGEIVLSLFNEQFPESIP
ncbi:MAG: hypothetical protein KF861_22825, partial [Planctomycetaceae bacterium]|nr:hypothetical protein [Planctomycetaceae bacterium]